MLSKGTYLAAHNARGKPARQTYTNFCRAPPARSNGERKWYPLSPPLSKPDLYLEAAPGSVSFQESRYGTYLFAENQHIESTNSRRCLRSEHGKY